MINLRILHKNDNMGNSGVFPGGVLYLDNKEMTTLEILN
jgi:hypothetical protein